MINVNGNLINEEKILQVKPYTITKEVGWNCDKVYISNLEITYANGIVSNIKATLKQYEKALKGGNNEE